MKKIAVYSILTLLLACLSGTALADPSQITCHTNQDGLVHTHQSHSNQDSIVKHCLPSSLSNQGDPFFLVGNNEDALYLEEYVGQKILPSTVFIVRIPRSSQSSLELHTLHALADHQILSEPLLHSNQDGIVAISSIVSGDTPAELHGEPWLYLELVSWNGELVDSLFLNYTQSTHK